MAMLTELVDPNAVCILKEQDLLFSHLAKNPNSEAGARKRMPAQQMGIQAHLSTYAANLVFEQHPERLDDFELHEIRQAPHIVVRLDGGAGPSCGGHTLNDVWVDGALSQPLDSIQQAAFFIEYIDEGGADGLPFPLWIRNTGQGLVKPIG